jgi:hypothetical protein
LRVVKRFTPSRPAACHSIGMATLTTPRRQSYDVLQV